MTKKILGVQLTSEGTYAVRLARGWKGLTVDLVRRTGRAAPASADAVEESEETQELVVGAAPSDAVFHRELELPFSDMRKLEQAAPLEAEESLPLPLEELVYDVQLIAKLPRGAEVLFIASPTQRVDAVLADYGHQGLSPAILDVDALALATAARWGLGDDVSALVVDLSLHVCQAALVAGGVLRTFHVFSAAATDSELLQEISALLARCGDSPPGAIYLTGPAVAVADEAAWSRTLELPVHRLPFPPSGVGAPGEHLKSWPSWAIPLGLALRGAGRRAASRVNLLRDASTLAKSAPPWKQTAVAVAIYAVVLLTFWSTTAWMEAHQLQARSEALELSIRKSFQAALPDVKNVVNAVEQLKSKVSKLEEEDRALSSISDAESSPLRVLRDISAKIPKDTEVELRDLSIDSEKLRIEGATTSYRASERVKSDIMAASPRFATASSDAKDGTKPGEVLFTLSVNLGGKR